MLHSLNDDLKVKVKVSQNRSRWPKGFRVLEISLSSIHTHNLLFLGNQTIPPSLALHSLNDDLKGKGKGLPQQAEVAQGVPGRLRPRIFFTFGTTTVVRRQPYAPEWRRRQSKFWAVPDYARGLSRVYKRYYGHMKQHSGETEGQMATTLLTGVITNQPKHV